MAQALGHSYQLPFPWAATFPVNECHYRAFRFFLLRVYICSCWMRPLRSNFSRKCWLGTKCPIPSKELRLLEIHVGLWAGCLSLCFSYFGLRSDCQVLGV